MSIQPKVKREEGTRALIICPTRELCYQIEIVISNITNKTCCNGKLNLSLSIIYACNFLYHSGVGLCIWWGEKEERES